jgi:ATP-dependent RNA helicase SUPV3L1/SUV3
MGYRVLGPVAIRLDMLERLAARAWSLSRTGSFRAGPELKSLAGCGPKGLKDVLGALGYRANGGGATTFVRKRKSRNKARYGPRPESRQDGRATA